MSVWNKVKTAFAGEEGRRRIWTVGILAVVTGCTFAAALYLSLNWQVGHSPDAKHYVDMAQRLVLTGEYSFYNRGPDAYVSPGYPVFLAVIMAVFGTGEEGLVAVRMVQCLLTAGTVLLTYFLGKKLSGRPAAGVLAAGLLAMNLVYCRYARMILTETLYFFCMMVFFLVFLWAREKNGWWQHLLVGVTLAVAVMVRPLLVILVPFLYLPHLWQNRRSWKAALIPLGCFVGGFVLVCLPWWIRNLVSLHQVVLLASQTNPIYAGLAPDVKALGIENPGSLLGNVKLLFQLLREHFVDTVTWLTLGKFKIIFLEEMPYAPVTITTIVRMTTLVLGLFGMGMALWTKKGRFPAILFWIYFACSFVFVPTSRYSLQYYPMMAVAAGWLLCCAWETVRRKQPED